MHGQTTSKAQKRHYPSNKLLSRSTDQSTNPSALKSAQKRERKGMADASKEYNRVRFSIDQSVLSSSDQKCIYSEDIHLKSNKNIEGFKSDEKLIQVRKNLSKLLQSKLKASKDPSEFEITIKESHQSSFPGINMSQYNSID